MKYYIQGIKLFALIFLGLGILAFVLFSLGKRQYRFTRNITVHSTFRDTKGVTRGSEVRHKGMAIGRVENVDFISDSLIKVSMIIPVKSSRHIYKNVVASVGQSGLVGGKLVLLSGGSSQFPRIGDGDMIVSTETSGLKDKIDQGKEMTVKAKEIIANVKTVTNALDSGNGMFARLIREKKYIPEADAALAKTLEQVNSVNRQVVAINEGNGTLGRLVNDDGYTESASRALDGLNTKMADVDRGVQDFVQTTVDINEGTGLVTGLFYNDTIPARIDTTLTDVNRKIGKINRTVRKIGNNWFLNLFPTRSSEREDPKK